MASRSTNTMVEVLERMLSDLAQSKLAMDADLPFLLQLETTILDKLRDPVRKMQEQGILPPDQGGAAGQAMGQGGMPMGMGGQGGPPPSMLGAGQPGVMQTPAAPNADELGRLLNAGQ